MLEWIGLIPLLGLTGNWRGYRMGGKSIGDHKMSTDLKKKFEQARASGNMDQAKAIADKAHEAKDKRNGRVLDKWGDGSHEKSIDKNDRGSIAAYAKQTGISMDQAEQRVQDVVSWSYNSQPVVGYLLNGKVPPFSGRDKADIVRQVDELQAFIKTNTPFKGRIHRGMSFSTKEDRDAFVRPIIESGGMKAPSLSSWTSSKSVAKEFRDNDSYGVLLTARNKTGVSIKNISRFKEQDEVLSGIGAKYKVSKVSETPTGIHIFVDEI